MKNLEQKIVEYWDNQPCNVLHSRADPDTAQYWNEITHRRYFVEPHIHELANFHLWQGRRVLEIGCGIGTDAEQFVRHGAEYVGIDISQNSVDLCRKRFSIQQLEAQFFCLDSTDWSQLKHLGQFDLVYSMGVIHHSPQPRQIVQNAHNLLKDQGEFRFLVYAEHSWKSAMIQAGLDQYEAQAGCPYAETYDVDKIHWLITGLFDINDIRQNHCFMYNVEEYRRGNYVLEPWFSAMPEAMRLAIKQYLGWHLCVKAIKK
jgi:2-polyprenyl-3-methyl-5-hydroxy-6-metoxy-1,4-benzoquinol methylase